MNSDLKFNSLDQELATLHNSIKKFNRDFGEIQGSAMMIIDPHKTKQGADEAIETLNKLISEVTFMLRLRDRMRQKNIEPAKMKRNSSFYGRFSQAKGNYRKELRRLWKEMIDVKSVMDDIRSEAGRKIQIENVLLSPSNLGEQAFKSERLTREIQVEDRIIEPMGLTLDSPATISAGVLVFTLLIIIEPISKKWIGRRK